MISKHEITQIRKLKRTKLVAFVSLLFALFNVLPVGAVDYTSTNFILRDPVISVSGGRSTAPSFEFFSSTGQTAPGESTSTNFIYRAGFLYFAEPVAATTPAPATPSVSGGAASIVKAIFSGKAYPKATVVLLRDAQIVATALADKNADFRIETGNLSPGDYFFSLYGKDYLGKTSRLISFLVEDVSGATTSINNVLISPTIHKDKKEVKKGEIVGFFGQSIPNSEITIKSLNGKFSIKAISDQDGKYNYNLDTSLLDFGEYQVISKVSFKNATSESASISFIVGDRTILEEPKICPVKADFNNDCAVNLVDFSILIYWFDKPNVPSNIDLSQDGKADLVDFSIMAYYWTG